MSSLARTAGELMIDHTDSPGIPAEMAAQWAAQGVAVAGAGQKVEMLTYTCRHCNAVVAMRPERVRPRNVCRKCMAVVCDRPVCVLECQPFEKIIDRVLSGRAIQLDPNTNLLLPT